MDDRSDGPTVRFLHRPDFRSLRARIASVVRFTIRVFQSLDESQGLMWATTLCYATLLAIVPLMAVTLAVASAFPVFENWTADIQTFIFENFVPGTSEVLQQYLNRFVDRASQMSAIGILFLVGSALLLMFNVDGALNRIWGVSKRRNLASRLLAYWTVLTLGPLLMTASVAVTSYLVSLPFLAILAPARQTTAVPWALSLAPFVISTLGFFIVYLIVPNTRVLWSHALAGALLAGVLFEATKRGFAFYVTQVPTYEAVYGAFAAIPIFLVWIYLSWVVTLVGATFAAVLGRPEEVKRGKRTAFRENLVLAYAVLAQLWDAQKRGSELTLEELRETEAGELSKQELRTLLERLAEAHFVRRVDEGSWFLTRDLSHTTLLELARAVPLRLPVPNGLEETGGSARAIELRNALHELDEPVEAALDRPLREFFEPRPS